MNHLFIKDFTFKKHPGVKNGYLIQCEKAPILNTTVILKTPFTKDQKEAYLNGLAWAYYIGQIKIQNELRTLLDFVQELITLKGANHA